MAKGILRFIPNIITSGNIFSGCVAVVLAMNGQLDYAAYFIMLAAVFDFFDGFAARLLKAYSTIGKDLDSLADVISFGLAPATIVYGIAQTVFESKYLPFAAFGITIFAALRLAKFNNDSRQTNSFFGLPVPAMALFIVSFPFVKEDMMMYDLVYSKIFLVMVIICLSLLMVSDIPMFSLKFKDYRISSNLVRYGFLVLAAVLIFFLKLTSFSYIIFLYILISLATSIVCNKKTEP